MSFIYPRIVSVTRANPLPGVGAQPYSGVTEANETPVAGAQELPASIQAKRFRGKPEGDTPSDNPERVAWEIFIPLPNSTLGVIQERDIVTDDQAKRYVVSAPYWNSLGYRLSCELLEA